MTIFLDIICVIIGGGFGALLRFVLASNFDKNPYGFPLGTFISNMLASFILGALMALLVVDEGMTHYEIAFFETGFCATLSTFSALAWQIAHMLRQKRFLMLWFYLISTFSLGMALFIIANRVF